MQPRIETSSWALSGECSTQLSTLGRAFQRRMRYKGQYVCEASHCQLYSGICEPDLLHCNMPKRRQNVNVLSRHNASFRSAEDAILIRELFSNHQVQQC